MVESARRLALNSTGRVMSWNSATSPNSRMPMFMRMEKLKSSPMKNSGMERLEPRLVMGMMALRSFSGPYSSACCTAWPHSCAATPMAAMELLSYTSCERWTILLRGS